MYSFQIKTIIIAFDFEPKPVLYNIWDFSNIVLKVNILQVIMNPDLFVYLAKSNREATGLFDIQSSDSVQDIYRKSCLFNAIISILSEDCITFQVHFPSG